jgi:hypothetical protein
MFSQPGGLWVNCRVYLTRALEEAYKGGPKPVGDDIDRNCARQGRFRLSVARASSVITLSIFVFGATDCIDNHLRYFLFSLPKLSNSNGAGADLFHRGPTQIVLQLGMACEHHRTRAAAVPNHLNGPLEADKRLAMPRARSP